VSSTIAAVAGTNNSGLGSERHVVYAINSARWWAFGFTGTLTLASWYSADGVTWTAGATQTLAHAHNGEGRNLSVAYKNIGNRDVVHLSLPHKILTTNIAWSVIRATISGTVITYHTVETVLNTGTSDADSLFWAGTSVEFDSNTLVHVGGGWIDSASDGAMSEATSTTDPGTAEQMTALTWTSHDMDSTMATETRSGYMVDLGNGSMGYMTDNGSAVNTMTGLEWATWSGSGAWAPDPGLGNVTVTGTISAIDRNDWGAVGARTSDVHVVYRSGTNTYQHRRFDGISWSDGQTIPTQNSLAGGGVALCSDGASIWLCVIDTDTANTVRYIQWIPQDHSGVADAWGTWQAAETSTQTRTWIGCTKDVVSQTGLIYWSEGSNLVAVTFTGITPADPPFVQAMEGYGSSVSSVNVQFANPVAAGNRIIVMVGLGNNVGSTLNTITDSAGNTYNADASAIGQNNGYMRSAPILAGGGTRITVTVSITGGPDDVPVWIAEYTGLSIAANAVDTSGVAIPGGAGTAHTATTAGNQAVAGEIAVFFNHDDGNGGSQTASNGITLHGTDTANAYTTSFGDKFGVAGSTVTGGVTTANSVFYTAIIVVYKMAPPQPGPGSPFPLISGLQSLPPQSPVVDLFATFAQPWSAPLGTAQAAAATVAATFMRGERVSPSSRSRSKAVLASPPTPTFLAIAPVREQKTSPLTRSRARVVLAAVRAASPFPTAPNKTKPSPASRSRPRLAVPAQPAASPFATVPNRTRPSPLTRARPRFVLPATAAVVATTFPATSANRIRLSALSRGRPRLAIPARPAASPFATAPSRARSLSPLTRGRPRFAAPTQSAASPFVTVPGRSRLLSPVSRGRSRSVASAQPAASPFPIRLRAGSRSPYTRSHPYTTIAAPAVVVATVAAGTIRAPLRGPGLRSRSRRAVAAPQTVTTASTRALRAPTRSPASRARSVRLRPAVAPQFAPVAATMPVRVPLLPVPTRGRPRLLVAAKPLPLGIVAAVRRGRPLSSFARVRPRFVAGANVVLGVPARRQRNRVMFAPTVSNSQRIAPAIATLQPGVSPTQQRELRVT
jgi:hypothetical protein